MLLVIPYQNDRKNGLELRYALRSMVKHFTALSGIVLVGDRPSWYCGEHIPREDATPKRKEYNIYEKLMQVSGTVLYSNDDYYARADFDEGLPNYYEGTCGQKHPVDKVYRELYDNCPAEWLNFDIHTPMIIDTTRFTDWPIDRPIKSAYANTLKLPATFLVDCKIRGTVTYREAVERIKDRPFFSTHGNAERGGLPRLLNELYPVKSKYES